MMRFVLAAALATYVVALFLPGISSPDNTDANIVGAKCLFLGLLLSLPTLQVLFILPAYSNALMLAGLLGCLHPRPGARRVAAAASGVALVAALTALGLQGVSVTTSWRDENNSEPAHVHLAAGGYVWLVAMALLCTTALLAAGRVRRPAAQARSPR